MRHFASEPKETMLKGLKARLLRRVMRTRRDEEIREMDRTV
jgi:hypothetical protein